MQKLKVWLGPILAIVMLFIDFGNPLVSRMAAIAVLMAVWWLTEAVHLAITSLLPILLIPLLGIADSRTIASQYMDPIIFLFIGGFIIAFAIERWNLHQRVALRILMALGNSPSRILFGVMITSFFVSMWISNTATVMMLLSAVLAIVYQIEKHYNEVESKKIAGALLVGLAFSATIGGMATLVGTPTNMIFYREYLDKFPQNHDMNFFEWFKVGFPMAVVFLIISYFILKALFMRKINHVELEENYFKNEHTKLGKITYEEKIVGLIFICTAILWFTRSNIDLGFFVFKGWENLFGKPAFLTDSTVAIFMALLLFFIPTRSEKGKKVMTWQDAEKLPFDIILLFGGGFALAKGFEVSGLSTWIAGKMTFISGLNIYLFIFIMCVIITIVSEFASNVACIQLMIPVLIALQKDMQVPPLLLLMPATLAASLGFMLPVATAPNTIVYGSGRIRTTDMMKAGILLDLVGVALIALFMAIWK